MTSIPARTHEDVLEDYRTLQARHQANHDRVSAKQRHLLQALGVVVAGILAYTAKTISHVLPAWPLAAAFAAVVVLIVLSLNQQTKLSRSKRLLAFYEGNLARVEGREPYTARTGFDAAKAFTEEHLYRRDLDILGERSLFSLLATVRTGPGERGLAQYLLAPASHGEALLRQQAVRELLPNVLLREELALLGASKFQQLSADYFDTWLDKPAPTFHPALRYVFATTTVLALGLIVAGVVGVASWSTLLPNLFAVLAVQGGVAAVLKARVQPLLEGGARLQGQIQLFSEGLALMQRTAFSSPKLLELQRLGREPAGAVEALAKLDRQLAIVEQRTKEYFYIFSLLLAAGTQAAISMAAWKHRHAPAMRVWLDAWAEFEALNALAAYAFEHPEDAWPELLPSAHTPLFEASALGHPLLPGGICNNVALGQPSRFYIISGSNMSGKSTLLRSIGINAVLAYAGAPVRAASLRLTPLVIGASLALTDSLVEGKSRFLAEVERLAAIVKESKRVPVLFLVDEIFSGTNSLDRRTAAGAVLQTLLAHGAIGALSTHDLALTSLADEGNAGINLHMASPDADDPLAFDYLLKLGVNQQTNALAIIRLMGL